MKSVMQAPFRSWDVQELKFKCKGANKDHNSIEKFWAQYNHGAQITVYIRRTAYSGLTNSARIFEHGANYELFTVQKTWAPITKKQKAEIKRLLKPSCGKPNCGHVWDNSGMTNVD